MNKWIALALLACVAAVCAEETPAAENQDLEQEESIVHGYGLGGYGGYGYGRGLIGYGGYGLGGYGGYGYGRGLGGYGLVGIGGGYGGYGLGYGYGGLH
ncbi:keratin-associated protein 19-2-like isoform X2 [Amphibalanus amphitrite]|uniref:keratin-associated protein 19-2-like isoform X2 n=1 Tax=Amphibalanus amphitrite TaxID=1232801 RepID=UPI001C92732D|nr:keratin-associated protein 19-2-like isoform X2 [Amphibalanus amphitrite]